MSELNDLYVRLHYPDYKRVERQLLRFAIQWLGERDIDIPAEMFDAAFKWPDPVETTHRTVEGAYHKALRLRITDTMNFEFQGPLVKEAFGD